MLLCFVAAPLRAQFYAPETHFHDASQRYYVVELARVLAWRENLKGAKVAEVTYALTSDADGSSKWDVKWLDAQGEEVRRFNVSYPASLLLGGPAFYREVFKQMTTGGTEIIPSLTSQQVVQGYWKGADLAGYSRIAGLRAAFQLVPLKPKAAESETAPQLAGLLPHAALSMLSGPVSIDPVLLARGAAWLALSEEMATDRGKEEAGLDALWAPLMFLTGRENAAGVLWKKAATAKPNAMAACWDFIFTQPKTADAFVFVAKPENRRFMMPVMNYFCRRSDRTADFEKMLPPIFGDEDKAATLLYDHFPCIAHFGTVSTGHIFSNGAPYAWQDLIYCLKEFQPTPLDFDGYKAELAKQPQSIEDYAPAAGDLKDETCVLGFDAVAPLIEMGHKEGTGKLIPVATVTARDLLNYGWETTGLQIGARYQFVSTMWGVPELAKSIADTVSSKVTGYDIFFLTEEEEPKAPEPAETDRLQNVIYSFEYRGYNKKWWKKTVAQFEDYSSRYWLVAGNVRSECSVFYHANHKDRIIPYIERVRAEGGPLCDGCIRKWFAADLRDDGVPKVPGAMDYKRKMAAEQKAIEMETMDFQMTWKDFILRPAMERAKVMEQCYWEGGCDWYGGAIMEAYIEAHAYDSAKRFYREAGPGAEDVLFSNDMGPRRYTLAMLEGDKEAMKEAFDAKPSGSSADMHSHVLDAAVKRDSETMKDVLDEWIKRYGNDESHPQALLEDFIPLIPALNDPMSPDHGKALDWFAKDPGWITVQWVLSRNAKLSTDETIRFFGGKDTDWNRQFVVLALLKDKDTFEKEYQEHEQNWNTYNPCRTWKAIVLMHYLRNELLGIPVPAEQPDLKPSHWMTLAQRVLSSLGKDPGQAE